MKASKKNKSENSFKRYRRIKDHRRSTYNPYVNDSAANYITKEAPKIIKTSKTTIICGIVFFFCFLSFILAYFVKPENWSWSNLFLNIAVALFQLLLAIIIVNIFMSTIDKRRMNAAGLIVVNGGILLFHNHIMELMIKKFGKLVFFDFLREIKSYGFNPDFLSEEKITQYIDAIKDDFLYLMEEAFDCSDRISQTAETGAFSGNPECLMYSLMTIKLFGTLSSLDINNPEHYKLILKNLMNYYYVLYLIRDNLLKQAGIRDDEEWGFRE